MFTLWNWIKNETWEPVEHMGRWRIRHLSIQTNLLTKMCIFFWIWTVHCNISKLLINTGELRWFYCSVTESILFILPIFNSKTLSSPVDIGIKINSLNWKWDVCVAVIFFNIDPPPCSFASANLFCILRVIYTAIRLMIFIQNQTWNFTLWNLTFDFIHGFLVHFFTGVCFNITHDALSPIPATGIELVFDRLRSCLPRKLDGNSKPNENT